eukprot:1148970-Pelagomonas_calceolata.AAC.4
MSLLKQDSLVAVVTYLQDPGPYIEATSNLNEVLEERDTKDIEVVSGVLEVQLEYEGKADQPLCGKDVEGCQLKLMLPLRQDIYNRSKSHACIRIVPSVEAYQAVRIAISGAKPTSDRGLPMGYCTSNGLGKHAIIQYTIPSTDEVSSPGLPERIRSKAFDVYVTVNVAVDRPTETDELSSQVAKEQLMSDISQALTVGLYRLDSELMGDSQGQMCSDCVKATKLEVLDSGFSLITLALYLPDEASTGKREVKFTLQLLRHVPELAVFKFFNATSLKAPVSVHLCKEQLKDISEVLRKFLPVGLFAMIKSALCIDCRTVIGVSLQENDDDDNGVELQPEPSPGKCASIASPDWLLHHTASKVLDACVNTSTTQFAGPGKGVDGDDDSSNQSAVIGGAVGGAVGGVLLLAITAAAIAYCAHSQPLHPIGTIVAQKCSWQSKLTEHMLRFV